MKLRVDCTILTSSDTDSMKVTRSFLFKLDAYLRSPGVFVGSKLHFWACICLSFFLCNYWFILWLFFLSVCQRCSFLTYVCRAENGICLCGVKTLSWRRVGEGGAIYIYIYIWLLFQYLLLDSTFIFFFFFFLNIELINFSFAALCIY